MTSHHVAQVNVARMRAPVEDPAMAEFVALIEPVNAIADASPGFVWRLETYEGDATAVRAYDDPRILFNLSVWESVESLEIFVYRTRHLELVRDRDRWFEPEGSAFALWWIPADHRPTLDEARRAVESIREEARTSGSSRSAPDLRRRRRCEEVEHPLEDST